MRDLDGRNSRAGMRFLAHSYLEIRSLYRQLRSRIGADFTVVPIAAGLEQVPRSLFHFD
jgi:hypothetical protein